MKLTTVMLLVAAGLTACANDASDDVATAESPGVSATVSPSATPDAKQFAACLRARGLEVDDPPQGGQVRLNSKDDKTRAALRACQRYAPVTTRDDEGAIDPAAARAYAACIRGKGFPDFPDPDSRGPQIPKDLIHDERFKAADRDCAHHLSETKGAKE